MEISERLKSAVDIVAVVGEYVRLKRVGAGPRYVGLCPFHNEKTPSFSVHGQHQFFKCFGCGKGGDVYTFLRELQGLTFPEALQVLSDRTGIPIPSRRGGEADDADVRMRAALYRIHEIALQLYCRNLAGPQGTAARDYLHDRGLSDETISRFELGYAEPGGQQLTRLLQKEQFTAEEMDESGLVRRREDQSFYDAFRGRLMFPIHSESGKVIALAGRLLQGEDGPKYVNSPETRLYKKKSVLYNLHRAKEAMRGGNRVVVVEGYMDVIGVSAAGMAEVVAACGTAISPEHVAQIKRHTRQVVLNLDPDNAGQEGAAKTIETLLKESMRVRVLQLQSGLDPDEYVKERGAQAYVQAVEQAADYYTWLAARAKAKFDMSSADGRAEAFAFLAPKVQQMPNEVDRVAIATELARTLGIDPSFVYRHFRREMRRDAPSAAMERPRLDPSLLREAMLLHTVLNNEEIRSQVLAVLRNMPALERFRTRAAFAAAFAVEEEGAPFTVAALEARLGEEDRALVHDLLLSDMPVDEAISTDQVIATIKAIEADGRKAESGALRERIREAEKSGNFEEALRLNGELSDLGRK